MSHKDQILNTMVGFLAARRREFCGNCHATTSMQLLLLSRERTCSSARLNWLCVTHTDSSPPGWDGRASTMARAQRLLLEETNERA